MTGLAYDELIHSPEQLDRLVSRLKGSPLVDDHGRRLRVTIQREEEGQTEDQRKLMWALLSDIAQQVPWSVNGEVGLMCKEDWKELMTASLTGELRVAEGLDGGIVLIGHSTSAKKKKAMGLLIDFIVVFGDSRGVIWSKPK